MRAVTFLNVSTIVLTFVVLAASLAPVQPVGVSQPAAIAANATTAQLIA